MNPDQKPPLPVPPDPNQQISPSNPPYGLSSEPASPNNNPPINSVKPSAETQTQPTAPSSNTQQPIQPGLSPLPLGAAEFMSNYAQKPPAGKFRRLVSSKFFVGLCCLTAAVLVVGGWLAYDRVFSVDEATVLKAFNKQHSTIFNNYTNLRDVNLMSFESSDDAEKLKKASKDFIDEVARNKELFEDYKKVAFKFSSLRDKELAKNIEASIKEGERCYKYLDDYHQDVVLFGPAMQSWYKAVKPVEAVLLSSPPDRNKISTVLKEAAERSRSFAEQIRSLEPRLERYKTIRELIAKDFEYRSKYLVEKAEEYSKNRFAYAYFKVSSGYLTDPKSDPATQYAIEKNKAPADFKAVCEEGSGSKELAQRYKRFNFEADKGGIEGLINL